MSIKHLFVKLAARITGRKCCRCQYNRRNTCTNSHQGAFSRCWQSLDRPYFLKRVENQAPGDLTDEELHQLGKIVASLQEASSTAKDAGLLGED